MSTKRILVIDDEKHLCLVIKACLEHLGGWHVLTAESGQEGMLRAETDRPDAILLDVMMPDVDGLTLFHRLEKNLVTRSIPVILLTAKVQVSDHSQFAALDIAGVIAKPFDPLTLTNQVAEILGWEKL